MKSADCALLIVGEDGHLADGNQGLFMLNRISFRRRQRNSGARKHRAEFVEPREDAPTALESSEQPLDLVPKLAEFAITVPFDFPVRFRRHDRHHPQGLHKSAGLVALVGAVQRRRRIPTGWSQLSDRARPSGASWACPRNEFAASGLGNSAPALSGSFHLTASAFGSPARNCRNWRSPRGGFPPRG